MAATDSFTNTVPLGEAGTGAAYILPQSQAIANIGNYIDSNAAAQAKAQQQKLLAAQQLAASYQKNRLDIKGARLWQPDIDNVANQVMTTGQGLYKNNIDPNKFYNDTDTQNLVNGYNGLRTKALNMADVRDQYLKQLDENDKLIAAHPHGFYDQKGIDAQHQFMNTPLDKLISNGEQVPTLQQAFDPNSLLKQIPTVPIETSSVDKNGVARKLIVPNSSAHTQLATAVIENSPEAQAYISDKTNVPYSAIPPTTDVKALTQQLDDHYRSAPNIPSLAAQGFNTYGTFGQQSNANSNGIPDNTVQNGISSPQPPVNSKYYNFIINQANTLANAAKYKQSFIKSLSDQKDAEVHQVNDQSYKFEYADEMRKRIQQGQSDIKFADWLENKQNESGQLTIGNSDSYVPVRKQYTNPGADGTVGANGVIKSAGAEPEKGAALYSVNLPPIKTVVKPALITNTSNGLTSKNTNPINVDISQIKMSPVWKGLVNNDPRNGSEVSARQMNDIMTGKDKSVSLNNITFQPYAYGIQHLKDANDVHIKDIPVKFSYDALKGSNVKKINTSTFDKQGQDLQDLKTKMDAKGWPQQKQLEFLLQHYGVDLTQQ